MKGIQADNNAIIPKCMFLVFIILRPIRLRVGVMASYDICPNLQVLSLLQYLLQFHGFVGGDEVHTLTYQPLHVLRVVHGPGIYFHA